MDLDLVPRFVLFHNGGAAVTKIEFLICLFKKNGNCAKNIKISY